MRGQQCLMRYGFPVLVGVSLVTAGLADFLFYKQVIGWTLGGFVAWMLTMILVRNGRAVLRGRQRIWGWAMLLVTVGLCVSLVLEPGVLAVVLALVALGSLAMLRRGDDAMLGWEWFGRLFVVWVLTLVRPAMDTRIVHRWQRRSAALGGRAMALAKLGWALAGIIVPALLSLIFLGLFALANPVVQQWFSSASQRVGDFLSNVTDDLTFGRILLWYLALVACWGLLRHRGTRRRVVRARPSRDIRPAQADAFYSDAHPIHCPAARKRERSCDGLDHPARAQDDEAGTHQSDKAAWITGRTRNLIVRCLVAMNTVFAVQLVLDSRYLVLGDALPQGMSYAEYAHRGAYPLIFTALLAAALVLAVFRPGGIAQRSAWARRLVLLWILQNVALVVSAVWRLGAYIEVYSLTRLRVAAGVWMLMVAGCLFLLLWRIARQRDNAWLTRWAMGWGLVVLWVCSFVPFDPAIARYNVLNCEELGGHAGPIDIAYLQALGPDALPAVDLLIEKLPPDYADAPSGYERSRDGYIVGADYERWDGGRRYASRQEPAQPDMTLGDVLGDLRIELQNELDQDLSDWRGWTVRRARLKQATGG
ncbi:MAG: DUF4173 domain-containing protein [Phycisphaeraceae bacterium]